MINVGILGAGKIASTMAETLRKMDRVAAYLVGSRDIQRARDFAKEHGCQKAYGSYEQLVQDPDVDLVYIATPHSHHYDHIMLCLQHGKHVLCEKSFTVNEQQAQKALDFARTKGLLLAEAIWTRYIPMRRTLDEILASRIIGTPHMLTANLGYLVSQKERIASPDLAGGALLDLGIYPLNFASMVFGNEIASITGTAVISERGVDLQNSITLVYQDGRMAVLNSSAVGLSDRRGIIYGDQGFIEVDNINNCEGIRVYNTDRQLKAEYGRPKQISGYEYEVEACIDAIDQGSTECPQMPHQEILQMMNWMDQLRSQWGMVYPCES